VICTHSIHITMTTHSSYHLDDLRISMRKLREWIIHIIMSLFKLCIHKLRSSYKR